MTADYKHNFIEVYNKCADDIFAYCNRKIANREMAKYLTRNIFMRTWDIIAYTGNGLQSIEKTLYKTAKQVIHGFESTNRYDMRYRENLWNLTLSQ